MKNKQGQLSEQLNQPFGQTEALTQSPSEASEVMERETKSFYDDPAEFIQRMSNREGLYSGMEYPQMYVLELVKMGKIKAEELDNACVQWLNKIDISKTAEDPIRTIWLCHRIREVFSLVLSDRREGQTKFAKSVGWFRQHKKEFLDLSVEDGGHWERVKAILREL